MIREWLYRHTVMRGDVVFLAGMGDDMLQVLFALNECYYVGDGNNLRYVATFAIKPPAVEERITVALQMLHDPEHQYRLFHPRNNRPEK
jgi:hypothetical protein